MAAADLWGQIVEPTTRTPASIMREQAALLGRKTQYLVEANVETETTADSKFLHSFNLFVPTLRYTFELFKIVHGVDLYPVRVLSESKELASEDEFRVWLGERLSSPKTRQILGNLIAQARS